jgi:N-formylglutamate amidohydrolase
MPLPTARRDYACRCPPRSSPRRSCSTARPRRRRPLVLDSPHSGFAFPPTSARCSSEFDLREGEDCFVDQLYLPATERGVGLIAALAPRTYIDLNRPRRRHRPRADRRRPLARRARAERQGATRQGAVWRTLDDGRAIYDRKLSVDEVRRAHRALPPPVPRRRARAHRRDARALRPQLAHQLSFDERRSRGVQGEGGAGRARARLRRRRPRRHDLRRRVHRARARVLAAMGYDVRVNDPYKGVELVRAYSNPAEGRMSLQLEINKRLYMDEATRERTPASQTLQRSCSTLVDAVLDYTTSELARRRRAMSARAPPARAACRSASSSSAAPAGRCRPTRQGRSTRRAGATVHDRRVRQRGGRGRPARPLDARRDRCAGRRRAAAREDAACRSRRPQPRLLVPAERAVPRTTLLLRLANTP